MTDAAQHGRHGGGFAGDAALLVCAVIWGSTFLVTKRVLDDASPMAFVGVRFVLASLVLLPWGLRAGGRALWAARWYGLSIGALLAAGFAVQTWALQFVGPSRSAFLTVFYVFFTPVVEWLAFRKLPRRSLVAGIVLAFVGILVMTGAGYGEPIGAGDVGTLLCAAVFAVQMVVLSAALKTHASSAILFVETSVCAVLCLAAVPFLDAPPRFAATSWSIGGVVYLAVFATGLVFALQNYGQARTSATHAGLLFASEPVWAALFSALILGERLAPREIAGACAVVAGLVVASLAPRRGR